MQSRTYHSQQMAGSGVAAVFNWGSPAPTTSSALGSWGGPSIFGGGGGGAAAAGVGGVGSSSGIASSGFSSSYAGPSSLISDTGVYKRECTSVR